MDGLLNIFIKNFISYDWIIFIMAGLNVYTYFKVKSTSNKVYEHFMPTHKITNINNSAKEKLQTNTKDDVKLTQSELLKHRTNMNRAYAFFSNLTTMFPLMGMLGTVLSLLPLVNLVGTEATNSFFLALTSTFWGIIAALIFKFLDSTLSYKIEDNEKFMEYILKETILAQER